MATVAISAAAIVLSDDAPALASSPTTATFSYADAVQTWTVPASVTSVEVDVRGAQGGGTYGGLGSRVVAVLNVSPGETMEVYVGGQATGASATGFDGGGSGGSGAYGGGDASDVRVGGTALADRVVVAGGGGGQGQSADTDQGTGGSGGSFSAAQAGTAGACSGSGGGGGTSTAGGSAGNASYSFLDGSGGSLGLGGSGSNYYYAPNGGGGGGGLYGGGGGGSCWNDGSIGGAGGGGSDYAEAAATSVQDYPGYNAGNGSVTITYPPSSSSPPPSSGSQTFSYTGAPQLWTVPAGVTSAQVDVRGAQGGGTYGGLGSRVVATVPVAAGQTVVVDVGGQPTGASATGFDGGGSGGSGAYGGGDASDVRVGGTALADRVVVAGGGGGQGQSADTDQGTGGSGGSFSAAQAGTAGACSGSGGGGGTSTAGGSAGNASYSFLDGSGGSLGLGGSGSNYYYAPNGGGGGGGLYGGGGGGSCWNDGSIGGAGGGGSDYAEAAATSVQDYPGYNAGNGSLTITWALPQSTVEDVALVGGPVQPPEAFGGGSPSSKCACTTGAIVNKPAGIDTSTGDLVETSQDISVAGAGVPLELTRTYDSGLAQQQASTGAAPEALGYGWSYNLGMSLTANATTGDVTVDQENGSEVSFSPYVSGSSPGWCLASNNYCADQPRTLATLEDNSDGSWTFVRDADTQTTFDFSATGQLVSESDQAGDSLTSSSEAAGAGACPAGAASCTVWTSSASGRALTLALNSSGRLLSASDGAGNTVTYCYYGQACADGASGGGSQDLYSVVVPGGAATTTYSYDSSDPTASLDHDIVSETLPGGGTVTNTYNSSGQVTAQDAPSGDVTLSYSGDNQSVSGGSTVVSTWPAGSSGGLPAQEVDYQYSSGALVGETTNYGTSSAASEYFDLDPTSLVPTTVQDGDGNQSSNLLANPSSDPMSAGDVVFSTDAVGNTTEYAYNGANQAWCQVAPAEYLDGVSCPTSPPSSPPAPGATDPYLGATISFYDSEGQLTAQTDPLGNTTTYSYTSGVAGVPDGLQYCSVGPVGYQAGVSCPAYGAVHVTGTVTETFDSAGDQTSATDADGNTTTYAYDAAGHPGLVSSSTSPDGTTTAYSYDAAGQVTSQVVSFGSYSATTLYAYDAAGDLYCSVAPAEVAHGVTCPTSAPSTPPTPGDDPDPGATITTFDAAGQPVQVTNPLGGITYTTYDAAGNADCTVAPAQAAVGVTCPSSPPSTPPTLSDDPYLGATITTYNASGQAVQVTNPLGGITLTSYDGAGNVTQTTTESNNATSDPDVVTSYSYNADNQVTSTTVDPGGSSAATTDQAYDPDGNVYCSASANAVAAGGYQCPPWQPGWVASPPNPSSLYSSTPGSGQAYDVTTTFYDADGDQVQTTNPDVDTTVTAYDADGRSYCSSDPANVSKWLAANPGGTYPYLCPASSPSTAPAPGSDPGYVTTIYDADGNTLASTDQVGDTTTYTYSPAGQVLTTTNPDGYATTNCYYYQDGTGQCAAGAPAGGGSGDDLYSTTTPATSADPSGEVSTYTYYPGDEADTTTTPAGVTTDGYDAMGDLTSVGYGGTASGYASPADVSYTYNSDGTRETMTDATGTTTYAYDANGDLTSEALVATSGTGLANKTTSYGYYSSGVLASVTYPAYSGSSDPEVDYRYDATGAMASETDWDGNEVSFAHDGDGNLTAQDNNVSSADPAGTSSTAFAYDAADQPAGAASTLAQSCSDSNETLAQEFSGTGGSTNPDGQLTGYSANYSGSCSGLGSAYQADYSYDPAGRVVYQGSAPQGSAADNFAYDAAGDPTTVSEHTSPGSLATYTQGFDPAGELTSQAGGSSGPAAISPVGSLATGTGTTLSVSPQAVGDLMVLTATTVNSTPPIITSVAGGGVSDWSLAKRYTDSTDAGVDEEIWTGVVTTTGAATITVALSGYADADDLMAQEFSAGSGADWALDTSGSGTSLGTPWDYPSLSATGSEELYYGVAVANNDSTLSGGGTPGFTYAQSGQTLHDMLAYDTDVSGTVQPSGTTSNDDSYEDAVGVLIAATASGGGGASYTYDSLGDRVGESAGGQETTYGYDQPGQMTSAVTPTANASYLYNGDGLEAEAQTTALAWGPPSSVDSSRSVESLSCSTATASSISAVGSLATGTGTTLSVSPQAVGDLMVLTATTVNSTPPTITSVSGGGVSDWSLAKRFTDSTYEDVDEEVWTGVVTATGAATITVALSGYAYADDLMAQEFSAGSGADWALDTSGSGTQASSPWAYPSLTATGSGELYYGVAVANNDSTLSGGGTSGFTYAQSGLTLNDMLAYDTDVSGTVAPAGTTSNDYSYEDTLGVLIAATASGGGDAQSCAAVDGSGYALSYNGSTWSAPTDIDGTNALTSVSCPTTTSCVAVDDQGGALTSNASTWSVPTSVDPGHSLSSVSCPSTTSCVAVDGSGYALSYNGSTWSAPTDIDGANALTSVSCPSASSCVAVDDQGNALTYNGTTWSTATSVDPGHSLSSVSCASTTSCVAADGSGYALSYNGSAWSAPTDIDGTNALTSVSCPSATSCVAVDDQGHALSYNGSAWSASASVDAGHSLSSVSCVGSSSCVAGDGSGYALVYQPSTTTAQLTWATNNSLPLLLSDGTYDYIYGPSATPVEQVALATSTPTYMTYDPTGSTWLTTDAAGQERGFWGYDAFGTLAFGTPTSAFGYAGQYTDATTGLSDMRARWYDPGTGEFTSVDPDLAETAQPYVYAGDDPVNEVDPSGQYACTPEPWTWAGCLGDVVDAAGDLVEEGAAAAVDVPIAIGTAIGVAVGVAWSALSAKPAGGEAEVPIYFGQPRISPAFGDGVSISAPPNGSPIRIYPYSKDGRAIAVAINNRTLANYSLYDVTNPPVIWMPPSKSVLNRLKEEPIPPVTSLPSLQVVVTQSQSCNKPIQGIGTDGVITSTAFAKISY